MRCSEDRGKREKREEGEGARRIVNEFDEESAADIRQVTTDVLLHVHVDDGEERAGTQCEQYEEVG